MYFYLYDSYLGEGKYEKEMSEIESYLTDLGITGPIERVSVFKTVKDILKSAVKKGAKTVVIVGNDNTFREAIKVIPDFSVTFGLIPVGGESDIAKFLGIPQGVLSCDTLSARIVEKIDIGKISTPGGSRHESGNGKYFFSSVTIPKTLNKMRCDGSFNLVPKEMGNITICNTSFSEEAASLQYDFMDPRDGKLDLFISTSPPSFFGKVRWWFGGKANAARQSHLTVNKIRIESESGVAVYVDKAKMEDKVFEIGMAEEKIRFIVGRGRLF